MGEHAKWPGTWYNSSPGKHSSLVPCECTIQTSEAQSKGPSTLSATISRQHSDQQPAPGDPPDTRSRKGTTIRPPDRLTYYPK